MLNQIDLGRFGLKMFRAVQTAAFAGVMVLALSACGSGEPSAMPDVVGKQLDVAKSDIERAGFGGDVEVVGGGLFGVVNDSNWMVCEQEPAAGKDVANPRLVVDRECGGDEPTDDATPSPTPSESAPTDTASVTDATVDDLLNRLNSADLGGIQIGERFRFTGELIGSQYWMTTVTGDYAVNLSALAARTTFRCT
ncbi:PASTA domain-containing protein [Microbacterium sp. W1N]|uniref:PASTA domain-containing protein n=1 Tax=Microbacterium festucae TaxID=2977531 RepID=UPI0021BFF10A|nr:PASTA domain-containing protein [Microbacterium festucae]MCT9820562.1 PASTA domain-containing protein [Microbacterium festucae]